MGWGSGNGKKEVLNHAADLVELGDAPSAMKGKIVLVDVSGWAHIASKRHAMQVCVCPK